MANITYRESITPTVPGTTTAKLSPLTNLEVDANFKSLNDDIALKANLSGPTLTGVPAAPTAAVGTSTTQIATTAFVNAEIANDVPSASETVAGRVELADTTETTTGTDNTRAVHPAGLKVELDKKLSNTAIVAGQYGGTGVANTGKTITVGGNLTTSGAFTTTLTATANTTLTLPTTGTLATLAGTEQLSAKTLLSPIINGGYTEQVYVLAGTVIDEANGSIQTKTLSASTTFTETLASGQSVILVITPSTFTITWPTTVWTKVGGSGTAPTLFSAGKTMVILYKVGTTLYGSHLGDTV